VCGKSDSKSTCSQLPEVDRRRIAPRDAGPSKGVFGYARGLRKLVEQYARQLNKRLEDFSPDEVFLRVMLEQNATHKLDRISVSLELPGKTLTATEEMREDAAVKLAFEEIVRTVFKEIEQQVEEYKLNRRGELTGSESSQGTTFRSKRLAR
jgi:hypothetical protein